MSLTCPLSPFVSASFLYLLVWGRECTRASGPKGALRQTDSSQRTGRARAGPMRRCPGGSPPPCRHSCDGLLDSIHSSGVPTPPLHWHLSQSPRSLPARLIHVLAPALARHAGTRCAARARHAQYVASHQRRIRIAACDCDLDVSRRWRRRADGALKTYRVEHAPNGAACVTSARA